MHAAAVTPVVAAHATSTKNCPLTPLAHVLLPLKQQHLLLLMLKQQQQLLLPRHPCARLALLLIQPLLLKKKHLQPLNVLFVRPITAEASKSCPVVRLLLRQHPQQRLLLQLQQQLLHLQRFLLFLKLQCFAVPLTVRFFSWRYL